MPASHENVLAFGMEEVRKDLQLLLDAEVQFPDPAIEWVDADAPSPKTPLEVELIVEHEAIGRIRLRLAKGTGILLSGLLMMVSGPVLADRIKSGHLDEGDADAISEIGNQIAGSLNTGLTKARPNASFHIRRGDVWLTGDPGPVLPDGPILAVRQVLEIDGFPPGVLHLVFDADAAASALGAESGVSTATPVPSSARDEGANDETSPESATNGSRASGVADPSDPSMGPESDPHRHLTSLLLLYETRAEGWETARTIQAGTGWPIVLQRLDGTARRRLLEGRIAVVVIDTGERKERALTACRRLTRLIGEAEIPVFLSAPSWRREEVQRAIRSGVSGILVKPLEADRVRDAIGVCELVG
jgi:CheY-like chemotaxis protein